MNKINKNTVLWAGAATLAAGMFLTTAGSALARGTDILHFNDITVFTNNGVEPDADGLVLASQEKQGRADNQKLTVTVTGLSTNNAYELVAVVDTDTNLVDVASFTTDSKGRALLDYRSLGNGHGGGRGSLPLPSGVNSVSLIREVDVVNSNLQAVLTADLTMPDRLQYLIKRDLSTNSVKAELRIEATARATHFDLMASGLAPANSYELVFNGNVVETDTTSARGRLNIHHVASETPPYVLDLRSVELWDTSSNVVLQTTLP